MASFKLVDCRKDPLLNAWYLHIREKRGINIMSYMFVYAKIGSHSSGRYKTKRKKISVNDRLTLIDYDNIRYNVLCNKIVELYGEPFYFMERL